MLASSARAAAGTVGLFLSLTTPARAECRLTTPVAECSAEEHADRLELALEHEADRAHTWRYVWTGVNGALAAGSFALVPLIDREDRPDFIVSGIGSAVTTALTFFMPLQVESDAAEAKTAVPSSSEGRVERLERLTRRSAEDERSRVTWPWHVVNFAGSALVGGIIAFGFDHALSGALTGASSFALGELQLFTQPTRLDTVPLTRTSTLDLRPSLRTGTELTWLGVTGNF